MGFLRSKAYSRRLGRCIGCCRCLLEKAGEVARVLPMPTREGRGGGQGTADAYTLRFMSCTLFRSRES